jgi:acetyl esterase/lipase
MLSTQAYQFRQWLLENVKNIPPDIPIEKERAHLEAFAEKVPLPSGIMVEPMLPGSITGEWINPQGARGNVVIIHLHGGGYTKGSSRVSRALVPMIAMASRVRALVIDYRLAPEHPFPAALEDAVAAYYWIREQGISPENITLMGDSAGGGLALATVVALRDAGDILPAAVVLLSPWTDLAGTGNSVTSRAKVDPLLTAEMNSKDACLYAGRNPLSHPLISPLYADLHGLPPMFIQVGSDEILLDDSTRLAARAQAAGVDVTLEIWEGMWHGWHAFAPHLPEATRAMEKVGVFIRRTLPQ